MDISFVKSEILFKKEGEFQTRRQIKILIHFADDLSSQGILTTVLMDVRFRNATNPLQQPPSLSTGNASDT